MNQNELIEKALQLEGLSFVQLAQSLDIAPPDQLKFSKGWLGQAVEIFLGAQAGCLPIPDFPNLNIELKTIPLNAKGRVIESTYVTTLSLYKNVELSWEESVCFHKLKQVLWVPIEGDAHIPVLTRRIGRPILWSPNSEQALILQHDWELIMDMVLHGQVEKITGSIGQYLHIRPKAANSRALTKTIDANGETIKTLPRGFYLRTVLTNQILQAHSILS
jgi:DNA mismatch repair protein MutH